MVPHVKTHPDEDAQQLSEDFLGMAAVVLRRFVVVVRGSQRLVRTTADGPLPPKDALKLLKEGQRSNWLG